MKYFDDEELKILDIEAGSKALIIKVEDQSLNQHFYGMPYRPCDDPENFVPGEESDFEEEDDQE